MATKQDTRPQKNKNKYRIRNWKQYNQSLKNRGSVTFWFSSDAIAKWYAEDPPESRGRPKTYSDDAILCALMIRAVFHCKLRQLQGFIEEMITAFWPEPSLSPLLSFLSQSKKAKHPSEKTSQARGELKYHF